MSKRERKRDYLSKSQRAQAMSFPSNVSSSVIRDEGGCALVDGRDNEMPDG